MASHGSIVINIGAKPLQIIGHLRLNWRGSCVSKNEVLSHLPKNAKDGSRC
jgi:hypothetical protein